jgi:2-keto-4-pentenoate hydratase
MLDQIAGHFIAARRERGRVPADPAPATLDDSYRVSEQVLRGLGERVGGWKVGADPDGTPVAAPMYASGFLATGATFQMKPGWPMIPEIEIAVRLGRDLPPPSGRAYDRADILAAASELLLGIELIERRIPRDASFPLNLADDLGNIGYVLGPAVRDASRLDLAGLRCRYWIDGELRCDRIGGHPKGDPLLSLVEWANAPRDRLGGLKRGQIVTLGSLTPMIELKAPARIEGEVEGFGRVSVRIVA